MSEHILEVKNLCKYFYLGKNKPPMKAVDDVSFYIEKGETVGLVGESRLRKDDDRTHHHPPVSADERRIWLTASVSTES